MYMSSNIAPGMRLNTYLDGKQNKLTNAINIEGIQLLNNTTLKTISLASSSSSGQITGGVLHTLNYLSLFESQDGSHIILDFNSKYVKYQHIISNTNKLSSGIVNVNGISLTNCFHFINH